MVHSLAAINFRRYGFLLAMIFLLAGVSLLAEVPLLLTAWWGAFSGFVPGLPLVPTSIVWLQSVFGGFAAAISGVRALADYGTLATVFGMLAVNQLGARFPRSPLVARSCCRASKGRCSLW